MLGYCSNDVLLSKMHLVLDAVILVEKSLTYTKMSVLLYDILEIVTANILK